MPSSRRFSLLPVSVSLALLSLPVIDHGQQRGGPPPLRKHTATRALPLPLEKATEKPPGASRHDFRKPDDGRREISANGIPEHLVGRFPNRGNPHTIEPQSYEIVLPADPRPAAEIQPLPMGPFGIALNGVFFDPGAAEFWRGDRDSGWQYEALGGAVPLGLDENHAHVQPGGAYHYHGIPVLLLKQFGAGPGKHSPQIGWAADGYPIYAKWGYSDPKNPASPSVELKSNWRLKSGARPATGGGPGGRHDGAFVQDYEFVENDAPGALDRCNGRFCVTPEYPEGTYAYFLTGEWPVIPRHFRGTPTAMRPLGPGGGPDGRPPKGKGKGMGPPPPPP